MIKISILFVIFITSVLTIKQAQQQFPKIVWGYFQYQQKINKIDSLFAQNHKYKSKGWQVRILNQSTVLPYIYSIPYFQDDLDKLQFKTFQTKCDYIKILLMSYYGGVWIDDRSILVEDLNWLKLQNMMLNQDVLNKRQGQNPDVVLFTSPYYDSDQVYEDKQSDEQYQVYPGYQLWFIAAKPNSTLFKDLFNNFRKKIIQKQTELSPLNIKQIPEKYQQLYLYEQHHASSQRYLHRLIRDKQEQLQKDPNSSDLLAVHYYKIWHIKSSTGPSILVINEFIQQITALAMYKEVHITNYNISIRYFLHLNYTDRSFLRRYYDERPPFMEDFGTKFQRVQLDMVERQFCWEQFTIWTESYLYQYLIKESEQEPKFQTENRNRFYTYQCGQMRRLVLQIKLEKYFKPLSIVLFFVIIFLLKLLYNRTSKLCELRSKVQNLNKNKKVSSIAGVQVKKLIQNQSNKSQSLSKI